MIYLDANIFIYAYFKPKKEKSLSNRIKWCKEEAKKIVQKINEDIGDYCISLIQLSEVVNLLKNVMSWDTLQELIMGLISNKSVEIIEVKKMLYINAVNKMTDYNMDSNDISAYLLMKERNIKEIYTFDQQYDHLPDIACLPQLPKELK